MILSPSLVILSLTNMSLVYAAMGPSSRAVALSKRNLQTDAALESAKSLNTAVVYQICEIALSTWTAAKALGATGTFTGICVPTTSITTVAIPTPLVGRIETSRCFKYDIGEGLLDGNDPFNTDICISQQVASNGTMTPASFAPYITTSVSSINGTCAGIQQPFSFLLSGASTASQNFYGVPWNINCNTGLLTSSNPTFKLCVTFDLGIYRVLLIGGDIVCANVIKLSFLSN